MESGQSVGGVGAAVAAAVGAAASTAVVVKCEGRAGTANGASGEVVEASPAKAMEALGMTQILSPRQPCRRVVAEGY